MVASMRSRVVVIGDHDDPSSCREFAVLAGCHCVESMYELKEEKATSTNFLLSFEAGLENCILLRKNIPNDIQRFMVEHFNKHASASGYSQVGGLRMQRIKPDLGFLNLKL